MNQGNRVDLHQSIQGPENNRNAPRHNPDHREVGMHSRNFAGDIRNITNSPDAYAMQEVRDLLQQIDVNAQHVKQLGIEHRVGSLWDILPIVSNIRSHLVAGKEAEAIRELKSDMQQLQHLIRTHKINVDPDKLQKLQSATERLSEPGGISKWAATIMPFFRVLHREATPQRTENVNRGVRGVRKDLRKAA